MAFKPRQYSETGVYHIYARGNNKEIIFKDDDDKEKYIKLIIQAKKRFGFQIYAYAIMDNHLHILLKIENDKLSKAMQIIQQSYTQYYNKKYNHVGRVFQSRFKSKPCKDDIYLLDLIKYIHRNPIEAGLGIKYVNKYTSHKNYLADKDEVCDSDYLLSIFDENRERAREEYMKFLDIPYKYSGKDIYL